ncbi:MAG: hypothetical protein WBA84_06795 [Carnobacterium sp.]|uniref:hypothetical protein n=1 Tax=Carnobacterium sp. TaxID=48221 RepID=UPI003C7354FB
MKKINSDIGYTIGTVLTTVVLFLISLGIVAAVGIGVLKLWMYLIDVIQAVF